MLESTEPPRGLATHQIRAVGHVESLLKRAIHNGDEVVQNATKLDDNLQPWLIELEGGLLPQPIFWEACLYLVKTKPLRLFLILWWAMTNREKLKHDAYHADGFSTETLPYHPEFRSALHEAHANGRPLALLASVPLSLAQRVADQLGCFSHVHSRLPPEKSKSEDSARERAPSWWNAIFAKDGALEQDPIPFTYICGSGYRKEILEQATELISVHGQQGILIQNRSPQKVYPRQQEKGPAILKAMRLHQWAKNALLFIPLLLAHRWQEVTVFVEVLLGFVSFGLCASSVYVLNDLLDVVADRKHHRKKNRPFASGALSVPMGFFLIAFLLPLGACLAYAVSPAFMKVMAIYYGTTVAYSFWLKQVAMVDVLVLAGLYTIRLLAGAAAASVELSFWLVAFSLFFFLNLALVKRFTEMVTLGNKNGPESGTVQAAGRAYCADDAPLLRSLGIAAGYISVLILALYLDSAQVKRLYDTPQMLWGMVPLFVYWVSRNWLLASREKMHDDPIVFALKDSASYLVAAGLALFLFLAL